MFQLSLKKSNSVNQQPIKSSHTHTTYTYFQTSHFNIFNIPNIFLIDKKNLFAEQIPIPKKFTNEEFSASLNFNTRYSFRQLNSHILILTKNTVYQRIRIPRNS